LWESFLKESSGIPHTGRAGLSFIENIKNGEERRFMSLPPGYLLFGDSLPTLGAITPIGERAEDGGFFFHDWRFFILAILS